MTFSLPASVCIRVVGVVAIVGVVGLVVRRNS
jgi:hypothetical protein